MELKPLRYQQEITFTRLISVTKMVCWSSKKKGVLEAVSFQIV
jgi:hypothetical protein